MSLFITNSINIEFEVGNILFCDIFYNINNKVIFLYLNIKN